MTIFTVGSILAGTSQTFTQMLFYRVMQGAGGGSSDPGFSGDHARKFPPAEQGMAMALYQHGGNACPDAGSGASADGWSIIGDGAGSFTSTCLSRSPVS